MQELIIRKWRDGDVFRGIALSSGEESIMAKAVMDGIARSYDLDGEVDALLADLFFRRAVKGVIIPKSDWHEFIHRSWELNYPIEEGVFINRKRSIYRNLQSAVPNSTERTALTKKVITYLWKQAHDAHEGVKSVPGYSSFPEEADLDFPEGIERLAEKGERSDTEMEAGEQASLHNRHIREAKRIAEQGLEANELDQYSRNRKPVLEQLAGESYAKARFITDEQAMRLLDNKFSLGYTDRQNAEAFGISRETVKNIRTGRTRGYLLREYQEQRA